MNDWYIDRSKNFINDSLDSVLKFLLTYQGDRDTKSIISALRENKIFSDKDLNPNAALTRFRDHGLIDNDNYVGKSAEDYVKGIISLDELIIDLFFKRPCKKKNSTNLKPMVILCNVFNKMFEIAGSIDEVFLTGDECYKYLYECNFECDITYELVDKIMDDRTLDGIEFAKEKINMKKNEMTNISIWFNALKNTSLFLGGDDRMVIRPNKYQKLFYEFISMNAYKMRETPTNSNKELYDYYCDRSSGLNEIIPYTFKSNICFRDSEEIPIIIKYLFGIKKANDFDFNYYFDYECFGIYAPFITMPGIVLRKIEMNNKAIYNEIIGFWGEMKIVL